ncbi:MAG: hypothetical protein A3K19_26975 [Lentisphaerae bacterium RIFOXYB12_FULL_65_16]|nr:MAG: hypothetical protein A3K18_28160 [Lentisphaerae bacterium RIFOXYA12_64_32]OGV88047.1 MAG: hypothetical protein A3K19_26975 [Lentisphaerae bacterium RIFOXYB12_FULL_65_16]
MEKICNILERTLRWLNHLDKAPVRWIGEDRIRVQTGRSPLLEFGFHSWGSETDLRVGEHRAVSTPGTVIVMNAHFRNYGTPRREWRFWCLSFGVNEMSPIDGVGDAPLLCAAPARDVPGIIARYQDVAREYGRRDALHDVRLKCAVMMLLAELYRNVAPPGTDVAGYSLPVEAVVQILHSRFRDPQIELRDLAAVAHLSEDHFGRVFRAEVGMAPMKYLARIRIDRARDLLLRTRLQVSEVAAAVGYADSLHFSRIFRAATGLSPRQFRTRAESATPPEVPAVQAQAPA